MKAWFSSFLVLTLSALLITACGHESTSSREARALPAPEERVNSIETLAKPIVVMISIDGFRADYMDKYKPATLTKLAREGAWASEGMQPSFPSLTFPNHITLITGKVPGHHGIVSNFFYDEKRQAAYQMNDDNVVHDGSWYRGEPIWSVAEASGMLSKVCFWVGSEATIDGYQASEVIPYAKAAQMTSADRAQKVIEWLRLPEEKKPHYIALYYSDVDSMGHAYGPNSNQVKAAIADIDASIGTIVDFADQSKLPVQFVIVSDHGMLEVKERLDLGKVVPDIRKLMMMERGAVSQFYSGDDALVESIYQQLKPKENHFKVYRRGELPAKFLFDDPDRAGDITVLGDPGYYISVDAPFMLTATPFAGGASVATHGWDPATPEMRALFIARGSMIKKGVKVPLFKNIHVYPFVLDILDLQNKQSIDGKHEVLKGLLQ